MTSATTIVKHFLLCCLLTVADVGFAQYTKLHDFAGGTEVTEPNGTFITDGIYLYGCSWDGGASNMGTIYKVKPDGTGYMRIHDFDGTNGADPEGALYYDGSFLYGMTYHGGASNLGVIYKLKTDGTNYQVLLEFNGTNGSEPYGTFVSDGTYLYAMTWSGGANNLGRIFRILPDGTGYQTLLDFAGASNGSFPASSLVFFDGSLFGMTSAGGANGHGTIFKIEANGTGYDNLYDFLGGADGREPYGALISNGTYLYGVTYRGGTSDVGTIFRIEPDGTNYNKLHNFAGGLGGSNPYSTLALHGTSLYGFTNNGGSSDLGILYKIKADGSGFTRLLTFTGTNGSEAYGSLMSLGPYLYGTTSAGGVNGVGTMFKYLVTEPFTKLLDFTGPINGLVPYGSLYSDGTYLYGMTEEGGVNDMGVIFKMKPDGSEYIKLLDFAGVTNGASPKGSLISDGTFLYGMTSLGGANNAGTVFKILPDGSNYTKLHDFNLTANGVYPTGDLTFDGTWLYGMTPLGGTNFRGTIFKLMPDGSGYTKISDFGAPFDGSSPQSSLYSDGTWLYGTTHVGGSANLGTVFKIKPDGSSLTKLLNFGVGSNGRRPEGSFVSDGIYLYGTTSEGGVNNYGTLFKIKPNGSGYSTLLDFDNSVYGSSPQGTPLLVDQFLYAMANVGGPNYEGTIFKIKTDGTNFKTVHEFSSVASGNYPIGCSLITDGTYFYGMTNSGGLGEGTIFRFKDVPENFTLVNFDGTNNGAVPTYTKLLCDGTTLYGMTAEGGTNDRGTIFKINTDGSGYTKIYDFGLSPDGADPYGSLYYDGTFFYGTTLNGGTANGGTIFKIKPDGTSYAKLLDFTGVATGTDPWGKLDSDGTYLYGVTGAGGTNNRGVVFRILPDGTGFTKLHDFATNSGGSVSDIMRIGTSLYGTTYFGGAENGGTIFRIQTDGTGFTTIHEFIDPEGSRPYTGSLVYDGTYLYGTGLVGGVFDDGTVYRIKPDGSDYATLHNFQTPTSGIPLGSVELVGTTLYGMTNEGGTNEIGTLYKLNVDGTGYETLMAFDGVQNGYDPLGTPCYCNGALYGMTASGGTNDLGTLFKYVLPTPVAPVITNISPSSGTVGTAVMITGVNFGTTTSSNVVYFGAARATVSSANANMLMVTVPAGATYDRVTVSTSGFVARSTNPFLPRFTDSSPINACTFGPKQDLPVGTYASNVKISDVNNSGKPDLLVTNLNDNNVGVLLANTSGFDPQVTYPTGVAPSFVAVGDLNGDGFPDLVTSDDDSANPPNYVSVLLGNGNGTFGAKSDLLVGQSPQTVAIGDLNLDGKNDLVVPNSNETTVSVLLGNGDGTFGAKTDFTITFGSTGVAIVDANEDGNPDLAIANFFDNNVRLLLGDGNGNFSFSATFATGTGPSNIETADLNADGHLDLITANNGANTISILLGNGTSFGAKTDYVTGTGPHNPVAVGDLNGDGIVDIAVSNLTSNTVSVFQGVGNGTFLTRVDFTTGTAPFSIAIGDINSDGKADMIVPNSGSNTISIFYNTTAPGPVITSFAPVSGPVGTSVSILGSNFSSNTTDNIVYFGATRATVVDATPYGLQVNVPIGTTYEYVSVTKSCLTSYTSKPFTVTFPGNGIINSTTFGTKTDFATPGTPADIGLGDFDGDGKADVVTVNDAGGNISLFRNTSPLGAYSFAARIDIAAGSSTQALKVGDIDGDGKLDVMNVSDGTTQVSVHRNTSSVGSISFAARVSFTTGSTPVYVDFGDLDGDGRPELAVINRNSATLSIFRNTGTKGAISFAAKQDFAVGGTASGVAIGDIDGDGKPEVVTASRATSTVSVFRNTSTSGSISFAARVDLTSGGGANGVAIGDVDGDGKMDIVAANYTARTVSVFRNNSVSGTITAGSFDARVDFSNSATQATNYISLGDVNGDNKVDILVANDGGTLMQVHQNVSSPGAITASSFATRVDFTTGTRPHNVTSGDVNGDGKPEILSVNASSSTFSVLHNLEVFLPTITSFTPASGPIGTSVTMTGTNFSSTPANNIVYFGATRATVTAATTTQLTVTVPTGATFQPISVKVGLLTAYSDKPFIVTFPDGGAINSCSFEPKVDFTTGTGAFFSAVGDFDSDGKPDIAVSNYSNNTISVFRNSSGAVGTISFAAKVDFTTGNSPLPISVADMDADGKPDLVVSNSGLGTIVSVFRNTSTGPGNINFAARVNFTVGDNPNNMAVGDFDLDGKPDIVAGNFSDGTVSIVRNTSPGTGVISFGTKIDFATGQQPNGIFVGDFDGDDKSDLVVANLGDEDVSVLRNTSGGPGSISFAPKIDFPTGNTVRYVSIGDLDGDNKPDFATANDGSNTISMYRNTSTGVGDINFSAESDLVTGSGPRVVSMGDLDGDGKVDLAASIQNDDVVAVYKNVSTVGSFNFTSNSDFAVGDRPFSVFIGDFDGDGKSDLVSGNFNSSTISVLRNRIVVPSITSFTPTADFAGATVTINGTNFDPTPANNIVKFNGTDAVVTASTSTSITTTVPTGATTGTITVTVACNTVTSASNFTVSSPMIDVSAGGTSQPDGSTVTYSSVLIGNSETKNFLIANPGNATLSISTISVSGDFSTFGTLPTTIAAGDDEILAIQFLPSASGTRTGTLTITSDGNIPSYVINLSGTGVDPVAIIGVTYNGTGIGNGGALNFSSINTGNDEEKDLVISNTGNTSLLISDIQVTGDFNLVGATPPAIAPASNATITLRFAPTAAGARTGTLTILSNATVPTFGIDLSGTGVAVIPVIEVTENGTPQSNGSTLNFSSSTTGSTLTKDLLIANTGNAPLTISDIQVTGDFALDDPIPPSIAAGFNATVTISFTPTVAGARNGTVTILSNGNIPSYVINLTGTGVALIPVIDVTAGGLAQANGSTLNYSSVNIGSNEQRDLTITNTGNVSLIISDIQTTGDYSLQSAIPSSIGVGLSATITVRFTPTAAGSRVGAVTISSNGNIPSYVVNLAGTGVALIPVIEVTAGGVAQPNGSTLNYSSVNMGSNQQRDLTITNTGNTSLIISDIQTTGDYSLQSAIPSSVGVGLSATITVRFTPTAAGSRVGAVTISSNGNIPSYVINLSGTGVALVPVIEITSSGVGQPNGSTLIFSSIALGSNESKDLIIANSGNTSLIISNIQLTGDFTLQSSAPSSIASGASASISVRFAPTVSGTRSGTITVLSNGNISSYVINLSGTGAAANPVIEITESGVAHGSGNDLEFSSTNIGSDETKNLVITNTGNAILIITDIQVTGDFELVSGIPGPIAPGASVTIAVRFVPTTLGDRTGTITIFSNGDTPVFMLNLKGSGGTEIEVYNLVSVNPNGKHDFLKIRNIEFFPNNTVSIFDRWGNKVFETNKYDNIDRVFKGTNDSGRDLPEGTYYYVINKNNGKEPFTGFLLLRR